MHRLRNAGLVAAAARDGAGIDAAHGGECRKPQRAWRPIGARAAAAAVVVAGRGIEREDEALRAPERVAALHDLHHGLRTQHRGFAEDTVFAGNHLRQVAAFGWRLQPGGDFPRAPGAGILVAVVVRQDLGRRVGLAQVVHQAGPAYRQRLLRGADSLVRLGGDEFTILLEDIEHPGDAGRVAGDVLAAFAGSWQLPNGAEVRVGASIGIALFPGPVESPEDLLRQADAALYRAKQEGRGRFHYFSEDLTRNARSRIELQNRLRHAIEGGELRVFFQPQVDIGSGLIVGAEALVRWEMPGEGLVTPDRFIPLAEETGLIVPLGRWVLHETCRIGRQWLDRGHPALVLAVNVAAAQLRDSNFALEVLAALAATGFPARMLELELTESSLMSGHEDVIYQLQTLRKHDIRVAIDDFGTGYSSLAYLKRFPLDVLKIDRSFVEHIGHRKDDREIVTAIIQMGHTLGFRVVAEGVETGEQLAYLKEKGCDVYQGYLKSHPLPAERFETFAFREQR